MKRDALFLQTKFTSTGGQDHRTPYDATADLTTQVKQSFESSLVAPAHRPPRLLRPSRPLLPARVTDADWEVWAAIEDHYASGKTRIIGISNVNADQLALLCAKAPHPAHGRPEPLLRRHRVGPPGPRDLPRAGVLYQGFSLLTANMELRRPGFHAAAARVGAGVAQVVFRFAQQVGMLPLTGTTNAQHMKEDLACGGFCSRPRSWPRSNRWRCRG